MCSVHKVVSLLWRWAPPTQPPTAYKMGDIVGPVIFQLEPWGSSNRGGMELGGPRENLSPIVVPGSLHRTALPPSTILMPCPGHRREDGQRQHAFNLLATLRSMGERLKLLTG